MLEERATKAYTDYHLESCIKKEALFDLKIQISKSVTPSDLKNVNDQLQEKLN